MKESIKKFNRQNTNIKEVIIRGDTNDIEKYLGNKIKRIVGFFSNQNFVLTEFVPLSTEVKLIIVLENDIHLHITRCLIGYFGEGSKNTINLFEKLGILNDDIKEIVFNKPYIDITFDNEDIVMKDYEVLFIIDNSFRNNQRSKIRIDKYVSVEFINNLVRFYDPQKHNYLGFLRLIEKIQPKRIEYYFGDNSPLENYYRISNRYPNKYRDLNQVNLVIYGKYYKLVCFINKNDIFQVVDTIITILKGKSLFNMQEMENILLHNSFLSKLNRKIKKKEIEDIFSIVHKEEI